MNILATIRRYDMFERGDTVLVAVSGGPDSVALLFSLYSQKEELGISLHIAHLNHGIRGEAADKDEEFVCGLAQMLNLPITHEKVNVPELRKELKMGEEEAAREIRHSFLKRAAVEISANKIALGHNADDRAESVLLNILRGTGIDGLGSIRPVRGNIVRPLINTIRSEIETYIRDNALSYRIDESNLDIDYTRNRVRRELIPHLERNYNPQVKPALLRLADIASMQADLVDKLSQEAVARIQYDNAIDVDMLTDMPAALQHQIIRLEIEKRKGDLRDITFEQTRRIIDALASGDDFTITLPSGQIYAVRRGRRFSIETKGQEIIQPSFEYTLMIPGCTVIAESGLEICAYIEENPKPSRLLANESIIDVRSITGKLRVRNIEHGDRIVPFGMRGSKKLQDIFVDRKIPRVRRAITAVVVDNEKIVWAVGVVSSDVTKISGDTKQAIHLVSKNL